MARRPQFQRRIKRGQFCDWPSGAGTPAEIAARVTYAGSPLHKTYPSPAGSPAFRADEAKCDEYPTELWPMLREALQAAIRSGCVGEFRGMFPQRAWIWINDVLHESRLTNAGSGDYHGFPIDDSRQYPVPVDRLEAVSRVQIPAV